MRIPSATGLVFASLALSSTTLGAPTPASPNPSSPNPGNINSPRPDIDSPRFPNSPNVAVNSPRAFSQSTFLNRRNNRVRRPLGRKRSLGHASPLIPDGADAVAAAPMQRSLAHISARDDGTVHAEGLGLIDQPTSDTVRNALHEAADALKGVPGAGPTLADLIDGMSDTLIGILGPDPSNPASPPAARRDIPQPHMRRQSTPTPDAPLTAEGLGLIPSATGQQLDDALHSIGDTVGDKVPIVGPVVGGLLGTVGDLLNGLITRSDIPSSPSPDDPDDLPASAYQQLPAYAYAAGQAMNEFVGPDGRVYQAVGGPFAEGMQVPGQVSGSETGQRIQQAASNVVGQATSSVAHAGDTVNALSGGVLPPNLLGGALGSLVGGVVETASGIVPTVGNPSQIIGFLANGLPVFSTAAALTQPVTDTASNAHQIASGMLNTGPASGALHAATSAVSSAGVGQAVGNLPIVGGVLGSLPVVGHGGDLQGATFGILSAPTDASASAMSAASVDGVEGKDPTDDNDGIYPDGMAPSGSVPSASAAVSASVTLRVPSSTPTLPSPQ